MNPRRFRIVVNKRECGAATLKGDFDFLDAYGIWEFAQQIVDPRQFASVDIVTTDGELNRRWTLMVPRGGE